MSNGYLPLSKKDLIAEGITQPDFVYVSGDAYVDHSSFGTAIICRLLQSRGYSVALICQPDWRDPESATEYGEPRLGFLVSSGNMDSMVNHYTVAKKRRHQDAYSPGGVIGKRPDYAVIVYCNLIRQTYKHTPIIIGGIGQSAAAQPLRLLVRQSAPFHPSRFRRRPHFLRNGRTQHSGDRRRAGLRP